MYSVQTTVVHCIAYNAHYQTLEIVCIVVPTQVENMRSELAGLNPCAVPFLSRAPINFCWYYYILLYRYYVSITAKRDICR